MSKFKIGDIVKVKECSKEELIGKVGFVVEAYDEYSEIGVCFPGFEYGHSCGGNCKYGTGWWLDQNDLELIKGESLEEIIGDVKTTTFVNKGKEKMNAKPEKKTLEQQIKERYAKKRAELNKRIGFDCDMSLEPKKFYYDPKTQTTIIDFGNKEKFKAKPVCDDKFDIIKAYEVIAAKRIYSKFGNFPFDSDMSSLESKLTAKFLLYKNTGIVLSKYIKYLDKMVRLLNREESDLMYAEEIRVSQKWKNQERKERRKARKQNEK